MESVNFRSETVTTRFCSWHHRDSVCKRCEHLAPITVRLHWLEPHKTPPKQPPRVKLKGHRHDSARDWCYYCGCELNEINRSRDHVVPRSRSGKDSKSNLVFCCKPCNGAKGSMTVAEWVEHMESEALMISTRLSLFDLRLSQIKKKFQPSNETKLR